MTERRNLIRVARLNLIPIIEVNEDVTNDNDVNKLSWKIVSEKEKNIVNADSEFELFDYKLNDDKAKKKFIKGAKLKPIDV